MILPAIGSAHHSFVDSPDLHFHFLLHPPVRRPIYISPGLQYHLSPSILLPKSLPLPPFPIFLSRPDMAGLN